MDFRFRNILNKLAKQEFSVSKLEKCLLGGIVIYRKYEYTNTVLICGFIKFILCIISFQIMNLVS